MKTRDDEGPRGLQLASRAWLLGLMLRTFFLLCLTLLGVYGPARWFAEK